jgi:ribosomal protein S18 acetylase RimI-like enzyme
MTVELVPASGLEEAELASLFTAVYAGYWHPIEIDTAGLRRMVATYDLDLDASLVARDGDVPVGIAVVARRDAEAWVGGMGVVPERRGAGLGEVLTRRLLENARERGATRVRLEVLEQNAPAIAIYRRLGFTEHAEVAVWRLDEPPAGGTATDTDVAEALERLAGEIGDVPWQRNSATVANMRALGSTLAAVRTTGGCAVYTTSDAGASLLQLTAATGRDAAALLRAPFERGATSLLWLNGPVHGVAGGALVDAGAVALARQHELVLALS